MADSKVLKALAHDVARHFALQSQEQASIKAVREERVALLLASIKQVSPTLEESERKAVVFAFGEECDKAGMAPTTIAARKSEFAFLLTNSKLIDDGAKAWRPTVESIRKALTPLRDRLTQALIDASEKLDEAKEAYESAKRNLEYLDSAEAVGVV